MAEKISQIRVSDVDYDLAKSYKTSSSTSLENLDVTNDLIYARLSGPTTFSLKGSMEVGQKLELIIESSAEFTQNFKSTNFINNFSNLIQFYNNDQCKIIITCYSTGKYSLTLYGKEGVQYGDKSIKDAQIGDYLLIDQTCLTPSKLNEYINKYDNYMNNIIGVCYWRGSIDGDIRHNTIKFLFWPNQYIVDQLGEHIYDKSNTAIPMHSSGSITGYDSMEYITSTSSLSGIYDDKTLFNLLEKTPDAGDGKNLIIPVTYCKLVLRTLNDYLDSFKRGYSHFDNLYAMASGTVNSFYDDISRNKPILSTSLSKLNGWDDSVFNADFQSMQKLTTCIRDAGNYWVQSGDVGSFSYISTTTSSRMLLTINFNLF